MTTVYKLFAGDEWLYVGIANNFLTRIGQHTARDWFADVTAAEFEHYPTREAARAREAELVRRWQPRHNVRLRTAPKVARQVGFPAEVAEQVQRLAEIDPRHNFSALVVEAASEWLSRHHPELEVKP